jgi:hypothetical protein
MPADGDWTCGYVLQYHDRAEGRVLHVGTLEECKVVADRIPAIAISNGDQPTDAHMLVMPTDEWENLWKEEDDGSG